MSDDQFTIPLTEPCQEHPGVFSKKQTKEFRCRCGKSFSSFPALVTHRKKSHDGKVEIGTYKQYQSSEEIGIEDVNEGEYSVLKELQKVLGNQVHNAREDEIVKNLFQELNSYGYLRINQPRPRRTSELKQRTFKEVFEQLLYEINSKGSQRIFQQVFIITWLWYSFEKQKLDKKCHEEIYSIGNLNKLVMKWIPELIQEEGRGLWFLRTRYLIGVVKQIHNWVLKQSYSEHVLDLTQTGESILKKW